MTQILTQSEINSLMDGLENGQVPVGEKIKQPDPSVVLKYDFASQSETLSTRLPAFDVVNESFSRNLRNDLTKMLGYNIDITNNPIETSTFGDLIKSLTAPMSLHIFNAEPLKGSGLLFFESKFIFNFVDTIFGGLDKTRIKFDKREFTKIEDIIIQKIIAMCFKDLEKAWYPIENNIKFSLIRSEFNPQFANITTPEEIVIISTFDVEFAKTLTSLTICLPYFMIESLREKLAMGFHADKIIPTDEWSRQFIDSILDSFVDSRFNLGSVNIKAEQLIDMKRGDVIELNQDVGDNIVGYVNNIMKLTGAIGAKKGRNAFKVLEKKQIEIKEK